MNKWLEIHQKACQAIIDGCDSQIKAGNYVEHMEACRDMWAWLLDNPGRSKSSFPVGDRGALFGASQCAACTACNIFCHECPLKEVWPHGSCFEDGSPYSLWQQARITLSWLYINNA